MALFITGVTGACEGALNALVGAVRLVVTNLTAVKALSSEAASFGLVRAIAGVVASLTAAASSLA